VTTENQSPTPDDVVYYPMPLFHTAALSRFLAYMYAGGTFIVTKEFDPRKCLEIIEEEKVTAITGNPTIWGKLLQEMEKKNILALGFSAYGDSFSVVNKKRPLKMPGDFNGLKIRTAAPQHADAIRALGGSPVMLASSEVYMALQRGTIDGAVSGPTSILQRKWHEVTEFLTLPDAGYSLWPIMINLKKFEELPADVQAVLREVAADTIEHTIKLAALATIDRAENRRERRKISRNSKALAGVLIASAKWHKYC